MSFPLRGGWQIRICAEVARLPPRPNRDKHKDEERAHSMWPFLDCIVPTAPSASQNAAQPGGLGDLAEGMVAELLSAAVDTGVFRPIGQGKT